jgi:hypothetical protein
LNKILAFFMSILISTSFASQDYRLLINNDKDFEYKVINENDEVLIPNKKSDRTIEYKVSNKSYKVINTKVPDNYSLEEDRIIKPNSQSTYINFEHIKSNENNTKNNYHNIINIFVLIFFVNYILIKNKKREVFDKTSLSI